MKRIFTFIAGMLLVSSGAFAQKMWENKVTNSNMEGEQSEDWSSFWCHEFRDPEVGADQFQGFANIIEDPTTPGNHCAVVVARSEEVARAAENIVEANGALASWDCQFFVYSTEIIPEGKQVRMTLRVRAEHDGYFETQAHWSPGDYNHYQLFGNVNVTTEWQEITVEADVTADHTQSANEKAFQSVAFNLSTDVAGNIFYFDDVKLEVRDPEPLPDPQGYVSLIRNGLQSNDIITFASGQQCTPFTGRDGDYEGDGFDDSGNRINPDVPARIVNDPTDGQPALSMRSVAATFTNEDGQARYTWSNGVDVELTNWQSQFFVSGRHVFKKGEKMKFCIDARADVPTDIETQIHRAPGDYLHYQLFGNLSLTEEWQHFEFEITIDNSQAGGSTVAFNCNVLKDSPNTYYFRNIELYCDGAMLLESECVVGQEDLYLAVPDPSNTNGFTATVDFAPCLEALLLNPSSISALIDEDHMKVQSGEALSAVMIAASTGTLFTYEGVQDDNGAISVAVEDDTIDGTKCNFRIDNLGEESFAGKSASTRIAFDFGGWLYVYNVKFVDEATYADLAEINSVTADQQNGQVYDLMGRRVQQAAKGLYIMNGKKYIVK